MSSHSASQSSTLLGLEDDGYLSNDEFLAPADDHTLAGDENKIADRRSFISGRSSRTCWTGRSEHGYSADGEPTSPLLSASDCEAGPCQTRPLWLRPHFDNTVPLPSVWSEDHDASQRINSRFYYNSTHCSPTTSLANEAPDSDHEISPGPSLYGPDNSDLETPATPQLSEPSTYDPDASLNRSLLVMLDDSADFLVPESPDLAQSIADSTYSLAVSYGSGYHSNAATDMDDNNEASLSRISSHASGTSRGTRRSNRSKTSAESQTMSSLANLPIVRPKSWHYKDFNGGKYDPDKEGEPLMVPFSTHPRYSEFLRDDLGSQAAEVQINMDCGLAHFYHSVGQYPKMMKHALKAVDAAESDFANYPPLIAKCKLYFAVACLKTGRLQAAQMAMLVAEECIGVYREGELLRFWWPKVFEVEYPAHRRQMQEWKNAVRRRPEPEVADLPAYAQHPLVAVEMKVKSRDELWPGLEDVTYYSHRGHKVQVVLHFTDPTQAPAKKEAFEVPMEYVVARWASSSERTENAERGRFMYEDKWKCLNSSETFTVPIFDLEAHKASIEEAHAVQSPVRTTFDESVPSDDLSRASIQTAMGGSEIEAPKKEGSLTVFADDGTSSSNSDGGGVAIPILQSKSPSAKSKVESWRATLGAPDEPSDHGLAGEDDEVTETDSGYEPDSPWTADDHEDWTPDEDGEDNGDGQEIGQSLHHDMERTTLDDEIDTDPEARRRKAIQDALKETY